eukprot:GHVH01008448.1.p1 GENE.GHVH01008448.1~~GHVH01008448.1.p1  ORF type:complete len:285 (+),score=32.10 GHVH01008448.1:128-982(+)
MEERDVELVLHRYPELRRITKKRSSFPEQFWTDPVQIEGGGSYRGSWEKVMHGCGEVEWTDLGGNKMQYYGELSQGMVTGKGVITCGGSFRFESDFVDLVPRGVCNAVLPGDIHTVGMLNDQAQQHGLWVELSQCEKSLSVRQFDSPYQASILFSDGSVFIGCLGSEHSTSNGLKRFSDGRYFEGKLVDNQPEDDSGLMLYPDSRFYQGGFHAGLFHGEGSLFSSSGALIYSGIWEYGIANRLEVLYNDTSRLLDSKLDATEQNENSKGDLKVRFVSMVQTFGR